MFKKVIAVAFDPVKEETGHLLMTYRVLGALASGRALTVAITREDLATLSQLQWISVRSLKEISSLTEKTLPSDQGQEKIFSARIDTLNHAIDSVERRLGAWSFKLFHTKKEYDCLLDRLIDLKVSRDQIINSQRSYHFIRTPDPACPEGLSLTYKANELDGNYVALTQSGRRWFRSMTQLLGPDASR
jgi:hypothetical protein